MDLRQWFVERLAAEDTLPDEAGLLVLAALDGDAQLDDYLQAGTRPEPGSVGSSTAEPAPAGAFLRSIEVAGFRGIGDRVTVELPPQPGLTIVAGRNGSGKSSLAEGLEVALTGSTYRWANRASQWKDNWRNLHHSDECEVVVKVAEEGIGTTAVAVTWPDGADDVTDTKRWIQRPGAKRQDVSELGWTSALETYRPIMSNDELGGLLEGGPSGLYDALAKALGMEQITVAIKRLTDRAKTLKEPSSRLTAQRKTLQAEFGASPDERATQVAALLKKTQPDSETLRDIATGAAATPDGSLLGQLHALAGLHVAEAEHVAAAASGIRAAVAGMVTAGEAELAREAARLDLRKRALSVHTSHGDMTCPVCGTGHLDALWHQSSAADVARREKDLYDLQLARDTLDRARTNARRLVTERPSALDRAPTPELTSVVDAARAAWDAWAATPDGDLPLADHVTSLHPPLAAALTTLREAATAEVSARQDAWAPLASRLAAFCGEWDMWLRQRPLSDNAQAALKWLKNNDTALKNERLVPIAEKARHAWACLRQESNVDLGGLTLEGTSTRRRVAIAATVDGEDAGALSVMSQGELHALSLALFLPRASMPESPFRFIVLDDPVQAMDPAKVDGLVQLLTELAEDRQVVVLSHDDRLPAAARRARVGATILEVTRGAGSQVKVTRSQDPAQRYLADARALVGDDGLPDVTLRRTLPGLLRLAVEAACRDIVFERRLSRGESISDVEQLWRDSRLTRARVSLALYDEVRPLDPWLTRGYRKLGLGVVTGGVHEGLRAGVHPQNAYEAVADLVRDLRAGDKR